VECGAERVELKLYESVIVAAEAGEYAVRALGEYRLLRAWA
jgi:hypothetical protein